MSVLLRDVIDIPERADSNDYVLRLTDSTDDDAHIRATLADYVLTESLVDNFDAAIELVNNAVKSSSSRAAYLVGSFGSGKSHFMAVLYALLGNHPALRTPAFQQLTGKYDGTINGKNVLRLTYHLLGAKSLEQAIFQGYVEQIRRLEPRAPLPALHISDSLLADAEKLRLRMGDDEFFDGLGGGATDDAWGGLLSDAKWDLSRYQAASTAPAEDPERRELVSALVSAYFGSFVETASYVDLDRGLVILSEHARDLGYDAVVLFLDELMLWLGFAVSDAAFFSRESSKLTKLVESSGRSRPIPLVSFISRQMDLRKWFADSGASGAEQETFDRNVEYQQGRFREIKLGDDNLAEVAQKRLLRPRDEAAASILDDAFARLTRNPEVWDVLRDSVNASEDHKGASEKDFRMTYPFSPVLVSTLRNLSSVMQRERTALKVMQKMLVDRRDTLRVDDLIPVGDSFQYIVEGGDPIDSHAATMFTAASELYRSKLLPALCSKHGVTQEHLDTDPDSVSAGFRGHDRIAKTLLLASIAPKVPALQDIDSGRLAALNHGSIKTRLAGGEPRAVLGVVRDWAQKDVPEISLTGTENPVIRVQLTSVDYQSVLDRIRGTDRPGQRRILIRKLIHQALSIANEDNLLGATSRTVIWRGSRREVDVVFGNVRDSTSLPDTSFDNRPGTWRVVIDYPFDEAGFSSSDDVRRIDTLISRGVTPQTIVWLPRFFSDRALDDLGVLVKLDWLFAGTGDRWLENTDHLSASDRAQAEGILQNLYSGTLTALTRLLRQAYGIDPPDDTMFVKEASPTEFLTALSPELTPALPPAADLDDALVKVVEQAYSAIYPKHPTFDPASEEVTTKQLEIVREYVEKASSHRDGRVPTTPGPERKAVRRVAGPLKVGQATEDHFLFGEESFAYWAQELDRTANTSGDPLTVGTLQGHIDSLTPAWGLRPEARDLVISAWVLLRKRSWFEAGTAISVPRLGQIRPSVELRAEELPDQIAWDAARAVASNLLGYTSANTYLTGANVADFAAQVRKLAATAFQSVGQLETQLAHAYSELECTQESGDRLGVARALSNFYDELQSQSGAVALINHLAGISVGVATETAGRILSDSGRDASALRSFQWPLLVPLGQGLGEAGAGGDGARAIKTRLVHIVSVPGSSLKDDLAAAQDALVKWVVERRPTPPPPPGGTDGSRTLRSNGDVDALTKKLQELLSAENSVIHVNWRVE